MAKKLEDQLREFEAALETAKKNLEVVTAEDAASVALAEEALVAAGEAHSAARSAYHAACTAAAHSLGVLRPEVQWEGEPRSTDFTDTWREAVLGWAGLSPMEADEARSRGDDLLLPAMHHLGLVAIRNVPAVRDAEAATRETFARRNESETRRRRAHERRHRAKSDVRLREQCVLDTRDKIHAREMRKIGRDDTVKPTKVDPRHVEARRRLTNVFSLDPDKGHAYRFDKVPPFTWPPKETP